MKSSLVTRDQFDISRQGIVHKPTGAAFTPHPGDRYSGTTRMGALGSPQLNGVVYRAEDVERIMRELWAEYVTSRQLRKLKK
jgi:hypothetical protein